jgi:hypothetical protein
MMKASLKSPFQSIAVIIVQRYNYFLKLPPTNSRKSVVPPPCNGDKIGRAPTPGLA